MKFQLGCYVLVLLLALPSEVLAQKKKKGRQTALMEKTEQEIELSARALRIEMDDFFARFAGEVEAAADSIILLSDDPSVREQALRWKLYAIPVAQRAVMQRDPFGGMVDAAVLCIQMSDFFDHGKGKHAFGGHQEIAIRATAVLMDNIRRIAGTLSAERDISEGEDLLQSYAKEHPLQSMYFVRENALFLYEDYGAATKMGFKGIAETLTANMEDLMSRMNLYTENLPKQIRWQSELMVAEMSKAIEIEGKMDSVAQVMFGRTDSLVNGYLEQVNDLTDRSLAVVDSQRVIITGDITRERAIILQAVRKERLETIDAIQNEREIILDRLSEERVTAFAEIDRLTTKSIDQSMQEVDSLVDHIFNKIYLLAGLVFLAGLLFIFLARLIWRR